MIGIEYYYLLSLIRFDNVQHSLTLLIIFGIFVFILSKISEKISGKKPTIQGYIVGLVAGIAIFILVSALNISIRVAANTITGLSLQKSHIDQVGVRTPPANYEKIRTDYERSGGDREELKTELGYTDEQIDAYREYNRYEVSTALNTQDNTNLNRLDQSVGLVMILFYFIIAYYIFPKSVGLSAGLLGAGIWSLYTIIPNYIILPYIQLLCAVVIIIFIWNKYYLNGKSN